MQQPEPPAAAIRELALGGLKISDALTEFNAAREAAKPDYVLTVNADGNVFIQCNRPMIPARAVELAKLLVKVAGCEGEELPMGAIR